MGSSPAAAAVVGNSSPPVAGAAAGNCTRWAALPVDPVVIMEQTWLLVSLPTH